MKAVKVDEPKPHPTKVDIDNGFSIRDALNILFCHKWKIILFFLTVSSVVTIVTYRTPSLYSSSATLLVGVGRERIDIAPVLKPSQSLNQGQIERVNNEMVILKSRYLAAQAADSIGLSNFFKLFKKKGITELPHLSYPQEIDENSPAADAAQPPEADSPAATQQPKKNQLKCQIFTEQGKKRDSDELKESFALFAQLSEEKQTNFWQACQAAMNIIVYNLSVEAKPRSFILNLSFTTRNPELAQLVLEKLIIAYINRHLELRAPKASVDVFKTRFEEMKKELENSEIALYDFRRKNQIAELGAQKNMLISRIGELIGRINLVHAEVESSKSKITELKLILKKYKKEIEIQRIEGRSNQVADSLKSMLFKFKTEESEISFFYPDDSRKVQEVRARIAEVEKALATQPEQIVEITRGINHQYNSHQKSLDDAEVDYVSSKAKLSILEEELASRQAELAKFAAHELTLIQLERQVQMNTQLFRDELEVLTRAGSYQALNDSKVVSIDIIETPSYSTEVIKPNKPMNIILGVMFGLLGGLGIAFLIDYFDDSMKTNEDVKRRLQLPVLAIVSSRDFYKCM